MRFKKYLSFISVLLIFCCSNNTEEKPFDDGNNTIFTSIPSYHSNIDFENRVKENLYFNFLNYSYIYNGGGVAVGDINNDGYEDIYFTSNQESNKLYLNKGNFVFEDITEKAGVKDDDGWSTGVTMVDINNDGWLDIYVCKSGELQNPVLRQNKLFINQKDNTFKEEASKYGLNQHGFSTQAYFFDYDKDGDLDMYLVNHRADFENNVVINLELQKQLTQDDSDHLFRNDGGRFYNATSESGIANKAWGLSVSIGDFNDDGWPDIYVANDFLEPDFLYINNQDGTFTDEVLSYFNHISTNSMGSDFADINNDLRPDLVVLDMMAADRIRSKENMASMSTENFNLMVETGYHHQYMSNMLQLNTGFNAFNEIGQFSGIAKTDWSWAPLIADFNNDGYNDLFVTNGIENDLSNQDFRNEMRQNIMNRKKVSLEEAIDMMPSTKLSNYMFTNNADYTFNNVTQDYGLGAQVNSNGAVYADLDNDGDLDLILNNQSDKASIYRNNSDRNFTSLTLKGSEKNMQAIGSKVMLYTEGESQIREVQVARGFQSSVSSRLHFGLGDKETIDSLKVIWFDGKEETIVDVKANRHLEVFHKDANSAASKVETKASIFQSMEASQLGINYKHEAVIFDDYSLQLLLPQKQSTIDNALAIGDVNGDNLDDIFVGNTQGHPAQLYVQDNSGSFKLSSQNIFNKDKAYNDNNALFFDADNDGDNDLYIATGNYSLAENDKLQQDRLYINDGNGNFSRRKLPEILSVTKAVTASDYDNDGDIDLFVGGRIIPGKYPLAPESYLLENRNGNFVNVTRTKASELQNVGLINDAVFSDYDNDGDNDLILAGEWMPITFYENDNGNFSRNNLESDVIVGWFQTIKPFDYDNDGDTDYLVGNLGRNNKFHPTLDKPLHIYSNYFDDNKSYDTALSKESKGELFPTRGKECSSQQTPFLNEKIGTYKEFANSNIFEVYGEDNINNALHLEATSFDSYLIQNNGTEGLQFITLPNQAQFGPTLSFETLDSNNNGTIEVFGVGNIYDSEVETVRYDSSIGYVLNFENDQPSVLENAGFFNNKDVKAIKKLKIKEDDYFIMFNANEELSIIKINTMR